MRTIIVVGATVVMLALAGCNSGLKSEECVQYFAKNEACAAKAPKIKAEILRKTASVSKENFEKNSNPMAVSQSCKALLQAVENDPDCK
jgi:hypothetical protein